METNKISPGRNQMKWPALKGNLIEITRPCQARFPGGPDLELDARDTLEMTGRVTKANRPSTYWFEGIMDDKSHPIWIKAAIQSFGVVPHKFITPSGEELGPEYFSSNPPRELVKENKERKIMEKKQPKKLTVEHLKRIIKEEVDAFVKETGNCGPVKGMATPKTEGCETKMEVVKEETPKTEIVSEDNVIAQDEEGVLTFESPAETRARKAKQLKEAKLNKLRSVIRKIIKEQKQAKINKK